MHVSIKTRVKDTSQLKYDPVPSIANIYLINALVHGR